jgi:signal transduction histidine kinase
MRYSDENVRSPRDFVRRRRLPTHIQYCFIFLSFYALIVGTFVVTDSTFKFSVITLFWVGAVAAVIAFAIQISRDIVLATEYQNAVFSSALSARSLFTVIARTDGTILHFDRGVQKLFPRFSRFSQRDVSTLLEAAMASPEQTNVVLDAVRSMQVSRQVLTLKDANNAPLKVVLDIEIIDYPAQFAVIHARKFIERVEAAEGGRVDMTGATIASALAVADTLPVAVLATNAEGVMNYANGQAQTLLGYNTSELVKKTLSLASVVRLKQGQLRICASDAMLTDVSGRTLEAHVDIRSIGDDNKPLGVLVLIYPLQPKQEQALPFASPSPATQSLPAVDRSALSMVDSDSVEQFIANAPIAIVRVTSSGAISYANRTFHDLTQNTLRHQLPRSIVDIVTESKRAEAEEQFRKFLNFHAPKAAIPLEFTLPNRAQVSVSMYVSKLSPNETVLYLIDVTEQKNLELRFAHSQKMQAVGQLAGGVAHDFNNLLTAMIGFCDLLLMRHPAGDQSFADIMQVKQNANRAANLVRQLLAFSRRQTLQPKMLDVTDVLAELSNLIRRLIGENIELKMVHGRNLGMIKADQGQLEQVIINLAVNARDAMLTGGILSILTSLAVMDGESLPEDYAAPAGEDVAIPAGEYIVIEVTDTGTGIPADVIPKIFEPFFSTKEVGSGTGLGLSTVYGIIKQTGGYVYLRSREGQGTSFFIYFPRYKHQDVEVRAQVDAEAASDTQGNDLTGIGKILLVEDETPVRAFAGRALRNKGYTVIEADCGETGLEMVRAHGTFDLIITDVIMPGINGPAMIEKIQEQYPDMKVVFISGYAEDVFMNSYGAERSFNFLAKPFTLKQLASKVKEMLAK